MQLGKKMLVGRQGAVSCIHSAALTHSSIVLHWCPVLSPACQLYFAPRACACCVLTRCIAMLSRNLRNLTSHDRHGASLCSAVF